MMRLLLQALAPAGRRSRLSVLIFHRVHAKQNELFPGEPYVHSFDRQLEWIKRWFNVLPLAEAVAGLRAGNLPARPAVITFDDGYADNHDVALPILRRHGLTATFFIASGFLDGGRMWNDTVIETLRRCPAPLLDLTALGLGTHPVESIEQRRAAISAVIPRLKYLEPAERQQRVDTIAACAGVDLPDDLMMTSAQVRNMVFSGMSIGAHTVHHPILARLSDDQAGTEMREGKHALEEIIGAPVPYFAYPNGKPGEDYNAAHVRIAREIGFEAALSTAWGVATPGCDLFQVPRFTPWDRSAWRYGLRLADNLRRIDYARA
ncbi:MAG: polysaccharide deacetylase family protein [Rhodocyclaceae bacterium]|nr:polysaccharide deacetylase family protein [Rhodocyclaceae bacterium]